MGRRSLSIAIAVALCGLLSACGGSQRRGSADDAVVLVDSPVPDAAIWLDGKFVAPVSAVPGGIAVEPGTHFLEIRHDSYHTYYVELKLESRERRRLRIALAPVLP